MLTLLAPAPSLISVGMLPRFFSAGAAIAARELRYVHAAELIISEVLSPQRVASMFKLSACKTAKVDAAFVLLCGSISRRRAAPNVWSGEPESSLCCPLVGNDFAPISDRAARFVKQRWSEIEGMAVGA
jgi:hypothetical protein